MESKYKTIVRLVVIFVAAMICQEISAQKHYTDKGKQYQYRSMENGKWEFHPGWYYITMYPNYCGGNGSILVPKFKESKSSVKQMYHERVEELALETHTSSLNAAQLDTISPIAKEETLRSAERVADLVYINYSSKFKKYFNDIDYMLLQADLKSDGKYRGAILELMDEKEVIKEEIEYIHEIGPLAQMEQAKRENAYEEADLKLQVLSKKCFDILHLAQSYNNLYK